MTDRRRRRGGAAATCWCVAMPSDAWPRRCAAARAAPRGPHAALRSSCARPRASSPAPATTMAEVIAAACRGARVGVLSGPSFAKEIAAGCRRRWWRRRPTRTSPRRRRRARQERGPLGPRIACGSTRSDDVTGVCLGGALKNVIAIAAGCCDGLGFGDNARAALITRGLAEMGAARRERMGGRPLTLAGLAGLGDLVLTCTGDLSRNRQVGLALARGDALADILGAPGARRRRRGHGAHRAPIWRRGWASTCRSRARSRRCCTTASRRVPRSAICSPATSARNAKNDKTTTQKRCQRSAHSVADMRRHRREM